MTKRLMLAMGLWFILLFVMMHIFSGDPRPPQEEQVYDTNNQAQAAEAAERPPVTRADDRLTREVLREADLPEQLITVRTENFEIALNTLDASVSSMKLLQYSEAGEPINFIETNISGYANFRVSFNGLLDIDEPPSAQWAHRQESELEHVFTHQVTSGYGRGLFLEKRYTFYPDDWHFDLELRLVNRSGERWFSHRDEKTLTYRDVAYSLIWGSPVDWLANKDTRSAFDRLALVVYHPGNDKLVRVSKSDSVKSFRWIGLEDRYFLFSVIPISQGTEGQNHAVETASVRVAEYSGRVLHQFGVNRHKLTLAVGGETSDVYRIFLGPKKYSLLSDKMYEPYTLSAIFDNFVLVKWLEVAFELLILFIYSFIGNYAIVIIIVTILIKILLHPLTKKSLVSMKKMQLLQPKMAALKEQFKGDPKRLNEEMMKLYKREGVNPLGGCLPMLLQLPVFIALYQVLPRMADLKNVSFLWIHDLSSPDTVATISAFRDIPLLPYNINILPVIMVAFSVLQVKMTMAKKGTGDALQQQQSKMMMIMPILFLLLFWNMPSGLVLYWTVQTIMSIVQQLYINRKYDMEAAQQPA
jgi:YidC/Oxa1 family membrane protein insertase